MTRFGLQLPWYSWPGSPENSRRVLREIAQAAEGAGFSSLWVMDHLFQIAGIGEMTDDMHESCTTLGYLAGVTERIELGALVSAVTYRHPGILVKAVTTLDVVSGGRAWFGIGAAWYEEEHRGLGVPFPPLSERFERLEETLRIAKQMWSDDDGPFAGRYYSLEKPLCAPQPLRRPHPPIMIGGNGEEKTMRLVARYGDACNLVYVRAEDVKPKLDALRRHCDQVGRDEAEILKTRLGPLTAETDAKSHVAELVETGLDYLIFNMPDPHTLDMIERFGEEIIPEFS